MLNSQAVIRPSGVVISMLKPEQRGLFSYLRIGINRAFSAVSEICGRPLRRQASRHASLRMSTRSASETGSREMTGPCGSACRARVRVAAGSDCDDFEEMSWVEVLMEGVVS